MKFGFNKSQIALAAIAALGMTALTTAPTAASAAKVAGTYATGDIHNHTTCSDGSISMQKLVKKSVDTWGLDWFVQAGHGGNGNRNCTLAEDTTATAGGGTLSGAAVTTYSATSTYDATLSTPAYPITSQGPTTTWQSTSPAIQPKGLASGSASPNANMWRWQSIQEFQYPLLEYLAASKNKPLFMGVESVVAGHEHSSMSVINGQMPSSIDTKTLPTTAGYTADGNANALAKWEYCFDRNDTDTSRGNTATISGIGNNWDCSITGSVSNSADFSATAKKLTNNNGAAGHNKTVDAMKWMAQNALTTSYYIPAHLERAGPFNPLGSNGFNVEHLRNLNNAAPKSAFAMESQPGHGASKDRGEYAPHRNSISGVNVDSVGGTTYGGTGVYAAQIGGVWDALLGEGRNFWFSASSDWHNRGVFGTDDRRSTQDFQPGEYQRNFVMVRNGTDKLRPQSIVDGMRTGNNFAASGQLIDRMAFIACSSYPGIGARTNASVQALAVTAATNNTDIDKAGCSTMGEKLVVKPGADIVVSIVVRDPSGTNNSPYTFNNPSLAQISVSQPLNAPVLDHVDVIRGMVTGYKTPGTADYSGQWPNNWLERVLAGDSQATLMASVPAAAKNTSAAVLNTFNSSNWTALSGDLKAMTFRIPAVTASQYVRLRGTNLPANVPYETDASGNPKADVYTNTGSYSAAFTGATGYGAAAATNANLTIPCNVTTGSTQFDHCPDHLGLVSGQKYVSYDVAAWADLWFYSNPIYVEVTGSTVVAGVQ